MALLHLEPDARYRLARYFDPPMYFLLVGSVLSAWFMGFAVMFEQSRSGLSQAEGTAPPSPDLASFMGITWLVPLALFFGMAAVTLIVFFALHEKNRPDEAAVGPVIEELESRVLDPDTVLSRLGLTYDDLRHPPLTGSETYLAPEPRQRTPYVRREADGFHRLSTRRAVLVAATGEGLHVYECAYDLRSRAKLEVRTHRVAYGDIVDVATLETSQTHRWKSPVLGLRKTLTLEERRIELRLAAGGVLTVPMAPRTAARLPGQVAEAVEPEPFTRWLREVLTAPAPSS